jgi:peptidoglycan/xylan/chitin deacetylase (PgdA/CDA1 family)
VTPDRLALLAGGALPSLALRGLLGQALKGLSCALCLHRATPVHRATDWQTGHAMRPEAIDALLELLLGARPGPASDWLTVTFDDGYGDAAEYLASRAARFPQVRFLFFLCPEKVERGAGFRWDVAELELQAGRPRAEALALLDAPASLDGENARLDLQAAAANAAYRLVGVEEARALARLPNVTLGNHTNLHLPATWLAPEVVLEDYRRSTQDFTRLFGTQRHFAFPYGTPGHHFRPEHVAMLRDLGDFTLWSTEARPFSPAEAGVRPRFPVDGSQTPEALAGWLAARALDFRVRGRRKAS